MLNFLGPDRMDYVVDFEDVVTDNFTVSIEKFTIPGEGLFLATANNHYKSHIFKWDGKKFVKYQGFKTKSAMMWKFFVIDYSVRFCHNQSWPNSFAVSESYNGSKAVVGFKFFLSRFC